MKARMGIMLLLGMLVLIVANPLLAQEEYRVWDEPSKNGITLRQGLHVEWFRSMASDDNGNLCVTWSDTRLGNRDVFAQLYDPDGNALWGENGVVVSDFYGRQEDPHVMPIGDDDWLLTWVDYRDDWQVLDLGDIYAQRLNSDGERQWQHTDANRPENTWGGVPVCKAVERQISVQTFPHGDDGGIAVWVDGRTGSADVYAQVINGDGSMEFETDGIAVMEGGWDIGNVQGWGYTADTDGAGGMIVAANDDREVSNRNIYCQRIDGNGNLLWGTGEELVSGMPLAVLDGTQSGAKMCPDGNGGAFFIWSDDRVDLNNDIYGQHISADGTLSWAENGVIICDNEYVQGGLKLVPTGDNEAVLVWEDTRNDANDLYMQKISDNDGLVLHWGDGTSGIVLSENMGEQTQPRLTAYDGGVFISFVDDANDNDLYVQKVDADGNRLWAVEGDYNGVPLCTLEGEQSGNIVRLMGNNRMGVVYYDRRYGSVGLYLQIYAADGTPQLDLDNDGQLVIFGIDWDAKDPGLGAISAANNFAFMAWIDARFSPFGNYVYFQKVNYETGDMNYDGFDMNGNSITPGYPYGDEDTHYVEMDSLDVTGDETYTYAAWEDKRTIYNSLIAAQKVDADGNLLWGEENNQGIKDRAMLIAPNDDYSTQYRPKVIMDGNGGLFVLFIQENDDYYHNLRMQKINADGTFPWGTEGIWVTNYNADHVWDDVKKTDDGDLFITYFFEDENAEEETGLDLYAILIDDASGDPVWEQPTLISSATGSQYHSRIAKIHEGMMVIWEDTRRVSPIVDIYGQIVREDGSLVWTEEDGRMLIEEDNGQKSLSIDAFSRESHTFWIAWEDSRVGNDANVYAQRFDSYGNASYEPANGILISDAELSQKAPSIMVMEDNSAYMTWQDNQGQNFTDLYYTHITPEGGIHAGYPEDGAVLCDSYHQQKVMQVRKISPSSFVGVWEDLRATGKEPLYNIYAQRVNDNTVGVKDNGKNEIPVDFNLADAYPNPFNPTTKIAYNLSRQASVKLTVYDVLGRTVRHLVNQSVAAGNHEIVWDGKDMYGHTVASGKYIYRLEANGERIAKSVVLLK